ncbi:uncharacterized protein LOC113272120 [Papaver somniferum]|uniref:uncharacterized protein LOC113272120 n=1 Tax=Papaver somniferum TaxID=3469 RepID=UPI000E6FF006|nr:uncharacterized protein LOC113272120 [Papaver somniferum]
MKKAMEINMFKGFNNQEMISHLQFADDTLVFIDAREEVESLLLVLHIYEAITGLPVNLQKSSMVSIGADNKIKDCAEILSCKIEKLPFMYLGMPVGATCNTRTIWDVIIEKFQKKLAPWRRKFLNKAGRLVLIKSTLAALPIYFMSIILIPTCVEKKLTQIMRNFLWGSTSEKKKINWIAWSRKATHKDGFIQNMIQNGRWDIQLIRNASMEQMQDIMNMIMHIGSPPTFQMKLSADLE